MALATEHQERRAAGPLGNPYSVQDYGELAIPLFANTAQGIWEPALVADLDATAAGHAYNAHVAWLRRIGGHPIERARAELAGFNLACWCPIGAPCHGDVLLQLANPAQ